GRVTSCCQGRHQRTIVGALPAHRRHRQPIPHVDDWDHVHWVACLHPHLVSHGPRRQEARRNARRGGKRAMAITAGYDVGGAHLKVALAEDGRTIAVTQIACPLWRGLDRLDAALAEAAPLTARANRHAATM